MKTHTASGKLALTVSQLNSEVRSLLENSFRTVSVEGEISNFVRPSSGHWYFTLKDSNAQIRCAMFRGRNLRVHLNPKEGDQVIVTGRVSLYEGRGDYQLICDAMTDTGIGRLQQAFEALKEKLQAEGLFSTERKRPLPSQPKQIGIVTSSTGAAIHDIMTVFQRRFAGLPLILYPSLVQGDDAAASICSAIETANRHQSCDVLIVGRGGGSLEDLWPFNEESVARAIAASAIPVVSAVGHEVDVTIADLVADLRAPTPSAAAELLSPDKQVFVQRIAQLQQRLMRAMTSQLRDKQLALNALSKRLRHPGDRLRERSQTLDRLELRLQRAIQQQISRKKQHNEQLSHRLQQQGPERKIREARQRILQLRNGLERNMRALLRDKKMQLGNQAGRLDAMSPLSTFRRGYSVLLDNKGHSVTSYQQVNTGSELQAKLYEGELKLTVVEASASNKEID